MRKLHNGELHSLCRSLKSRRLRWAGHVARMEESRSAFKMLTRKLTGRRPLRRPRHIWEDNIRMGLKEISINSNNWVDSAQDRIIQALVNAALNLRNSTRHGVSSTLKMGNSCYYLVKTLLSSRLLRIWKLKYYIKQ